MTPWLHKSLASTLAGLALVVTPWVQAQQDNAVPVGVVGPFTGPSSDFGIPLRQGIELAVDQINAAGGYLGRPIRLVLRDDKGDPDTGLKASQELVAQGVVATIGFCNTGVAQKSLDVFQTARTSRRSAWGGCAWTAWASFPGPWATTADCSRTCRWSPLSWTMRCACHAMPRCSPCGAISCTGWTRACKRPNRSRRRKSRNKLPLPFLVRCFNAMFMIAICVPGPAEAFVL